MPQWGWSDCPDVVRRQVDGFVTRVAELIGDEFVGAYLHGSLAMGCFNPERSDIDLLVVSAAPLSTERKRRLAEWLLTHSNQPCPIEMSVCTEAQLTPWRHPTPFEFHYSEMWRRDLSEALIDGGWRLWNTDDRVDPDLAAHITILRHRGIRLAGRPIDAVFAPVPPEDYIDSIVADFGEIQDDPAANPVYSVLNMCRVLYYLREGRICSKDEAGNWGVGALPEGYRGVVRHALAAYRGDAADPARAELLPVAAYMDGEVKAALADRGLPT